VSSPLLDQLGLAHVERVVFEHPPLMLALCQVKFNDLLSIADPAFVAHFQRAIEDRYPVVSREQQVELEFHSNANEPEIRRKSPIPQWRFTDIDDMWTVVLTQDFLAIETRAYEDFSDFLDKLQFVMRALFENIRPKFITRIGLRYINEIRTGHTNWKSVISTELLGPLSIPTIMNNTILANQQIQLRFPDDQGINITHGTFPQGSIVAPRQGDTLPEEPFYLLDFDVYYTIPRNKQRMMAPDVICNQVAEFNKVIYRLFRWSVTEEYISTLEVRL
jgi:uncharacterized protein (TIGR04255 family)